LSSDEKIENTNEFFENLFNSIDYNLLMIFLGTFIVVENIDSTGLPGKIFSTIVGSDPFGNFSSVVGICIFVLLSSQFLGNVAVIQLVAPNISGLSPSKRRFAWAIISFVATVGEF
jgi:Na+/H+ antiporter NhaD/arsenite permease-like protein